VGNFFFRSAIKAATSLMLSENEVSHDVVDNKGFGLRLLEGFLTDEFGECLFLSLIIFCFRVNPRGQAKSVGLSLLLLAC
jgi:hypothetical protein